MPLGVSDLFRWNGRIDRTTYVIVGVTAFLIKRIFDQLIAAHFHVKLGALDYWAPLGQGGQIKDLSRSSSEYVASLLLGAMPFIWIGLTITARRLRDAGLPVWLVVLFFVPVINLLFFAALCSLPPKQRSAAEEGAPWPGPRPLDRIIPRGAFASALLAVVLTTLIGLLFTLVGTVVLQEYGWSLFVALPFCLGMLSVLLYSYHGQRSREACLGVSLLPIGILGIVLVAVAMEGVVCLIMALPLGLPLAALGGRLGYTIQANHWRATSPAMLWVVVLFVPGLYGVERIAPQEPRVFIVRTSIDVKASPERVWQHVVAFSEIPPPREMLFRAGISYPIRAEISGHGPGAVRRCVFSSGAFVEPIEVWDEPRLLRFGVTANPPPLDELTPYGHIDAPHLHGFFAAEEGQFLLVPLPAGGTRLEGMTRYRHTMWPEAYWRLWSDHIIHDIHLRVLEHIRAEAEGRAQRDRALIRSSAPA
jgi:uncharacterized membrane protein YhaH (DUF805 family)